MLIAILTILVAAGSSALHAKAAAPSNRLAEALRVLSPNVLSEGERQQAASMVNRYIRRRSNAVNARSSAE